MSLIEDSVVDGAKKVVLMEMHSVVPRAQSLDRRNRLEKVRKSSFKAFRRKGVISISPI